MREIKLRVWKKGVNSLKDVFYITISPPDQGCISMTWNIYEGDRIDQYTGLKDKNGKEIYEGDVVIDTTNFVGESLDDIREPVRFEIVIGGILSILYRTLDGEWLEAGNDYERRLEVIGNIYENPELIENGVLK